MWFSNYLLGSDLKELCKYAATLPLREYIRSKTDDIDSYSDGTHRRTPNGNNAHSVNTAVSNECTEIFKELNNGSMLQHDENVHLRSITMKDFEIALKHIKSTMQAHTQHKQRYSKGSLYSGMFDPFLGAIGGIAGSNSRRSRYSGPPTVSSRNNNNNNDNNRKKRVNGNSNSNSNENENENDNENDKDEDDHNSDSIRAAGEAIDPLHEVDVDVE